MKKTWLALAALASVSGVASAQSSVTLFGVADVGVQYVKNGDDTQYRLASGNNLTSRLGVRGIEDLGGGLKAGFWLESHVNVDDGTINTSNKFWHRRSTVSLIGGFGELRLGRDTLPTWNALADFDPFGTVGVGDRSRLWNVYGGVATKTRGDNLVSYFLPTSLGGLYGQVTVGAGEGVPGNKYIGGRIGYKAGPIDVTGAYSKTETATDEDFKTALISGSYDFGFLKFGLTYQQTELADDKDKLIGASAWAPVGSGLIKFAYTRINGAGTGTHGDADQLALGYQHNLSKRTAIYTTVAHIKNKDGAGNAGSYTVQTLSGITAVAGEKSTGVDLGIRHSF